MSAFEAFWHLMGCFDPFAKDGGCVNLKDFERYPIWEYALDSEWLPWRDETWMRPLKRATVPWNEYSLTVAATFRTNSGHLLDGTVSVTTTDGNAEVPNGHVVITDRWYFVTNPEQWRGAQHRKDLCDALGESESSVFPIRWTLKVLLENEDRFREGEFT